MSTPIRFFLTLLCIAPSAWAQNTAPIGTQDLYTVEVNEVLSVTAGGGLLSNDYDPDGDPFFLSSGITSDHGELVFVGGGAFTYTPDADFVGTDTFGYRISDGSLTTDLITVTIEVLPSPNRAPVAVTDGYTTPFETALTVTSANGLFQNDYDPDGDAIVVGIFDPSGLDGTLSSTNISTGTFTYTPPDGFSGVASFRYAIRDPDFASSSSVDVFIDVQAPTNRSPQAFANFYATPVNTPLVVPSEAGLLQNDYDPDGDAIVVGIFDPSGLDGTLSSTNISTGTFTYTPPDGFSGVASFRYAIRDPDFASSSSVDVFISVGVDVLLPIELVRFEAVRDGAAVRLSWDTASETNNAGFEVERSVDGESFVTLGFVEGHGTVVEPQTYTFTDPALPFEAAGLTYRLKQIDYDGTVEYSPLAELDMRMPDALALHENFPNPFRAATTIRYELSRDTVVRLAVYDVQGHEVAQLVHAQQAAGRYAIPFNAEGLASGMYVYRLETENGRTQSGRMLLVSN